MEIDLHIALRHKRKKEMFLITASLDGFRQQIGSQLHKYNSFLWKEKHFALKLVKRPKEQDTDMSTSSAKWSLIWPRTSLCCHLCSCKEFFWPLKRLPLPHPLQQTCVRIKVWPSGKNVRKEGPYHFREQPRWKVMDGFDHYAYRWQKKDHPQDDTGSVRKRTWIVVQLFPLN